MKDSPSSKRRSRSELFMTLMGLPSVVFGQSGIDQSLSCRSFHLSWDWDLLINSRLHRVSGRCSFGARITDARPTACCQHPYGDDPFRKILLIAQLDRSRCQPSKSKIRFVSRIATQASRLFRERPAWLRVCTLAWLRGAARAADCSRESPRTRSNPPARAAAAQSGGHGRSNRTRCWR